MKDFLNDGYKLLEIINDCQFETDGISYCPLTQTEMAQKIGCSRMTINSILKRLKNGNYIVQNKNSRRYSLTEKAKIIIIKVREIERGV